MTGRSMDGSGNARGGDAQPSGWAGCRLPWRGGGKGGGKISAQAFTRAMLILSGVWFLGVFPLLNWFCPDCLPASLTPAFVDFPQYYAGAVAAKNGLWEGLYPMAKAEVYSAPPPFRPRYRTFLFEARRTEGTAIYYPSIAVPEASDCAPGLLALCPELKEKFRFISPPPLALLLRPLAWTDYETAGAHVWPILSMAAFFGLAFFSSRVHRLLRGRVSYAEGAIVAAVWVFSFRGHTSVAEGNVTPLLGCLIAFATYGWMRGWQVGVGVAMIPLLLFKMIGLNWCPLLWLRRVQWKTLLTLACLTVLLNGALLFGAGTGVYRQFFFEVTPKLLVPVGGGVVSLLFNAFGIYPDKVYLGLNLALCLLLYYGYWRRREGTGREAAIPAALAGTLAVFCLLNFSVWFHYFPNYLCFPFLGWMVWEGLEARGRARFAIFAGIALAYALTCDWIIRGGLVVVLGKAWRDAYCEYFITWYYPFFYPLFFLAVAFRRLYFAPEPRREARLSAG